jgi:hypothetical protein
MHHLSLKSIVALLSASIVLTAGILQVRAGLRPARLSAPNPDADFASLCWIAGGWETNIGTAYVEEHWTLPVGRIMLGMSRAVAGERTKFFEFLRIELRADGIFYVAHPQARPGVDFRLARLTQTEVIFENPGHSDHLKHIIYRKDSPDAITARIEGADNGKPFAEEFHYQRIARR